MGKKKALGTRTREKKDLFRFFCPYSKLRTKNLPIVKEQEISYVKKKFENIIKNNLDK